ncbi:MAG: anti-sigma factor family protein [Gemmatimonadota bacterium]
MSDPWMERLSEYLDEELSVADRQALETHLSGCVACGRTLEALRAVKREAAAVEDRPPVTDLWPGIVARLAASSAGTARAAVAGGGSSAIVDLPAQRAARAARRRVALTVPQLVAAAVAFLLLGGSAVWFGRGSGAAGVGQAGEGRRPAALISTSSSPAAAYEAAIRELELRLTVGKERLDPATVAIIEKSLATIDGAIEQARRALQADPANAYLNRHLSQAMARKVELLRRANALART